MLSSGDMKMTDFTERKRIFRHSCRSHEQADRRVFPKRIRESLWQRMTETIFHIPLKDKGKDVLRVGYDENHTHYRVFMRGPTVIREIGDEWAVAGYQVNHENGLTLDGTYSTRRFGLDLAQGFKEYIQESRTLPTRVRDDLSLLLATINHPIPGIRRYTTGISH